MVESSLLELLLNSIVFLELLKYNLFLFQDRDNVLHSLLSLNSYK